MSAANRTLLHVAEIVGDERLALQRPGIVGPLGQRAVHKAGGQVKAQLGDGLFRLWLEEESGRGDKVLHPLRSARSGQVASRQEGNQGSAFLHPM